MANLVDLYTEFFRIDLDTRGGYARVADVIARQTDGSSIHRAFKLMRHELDEKQVGMQRFENELKILIEITNDKKAPAAITKIFDSGFAPVELSQTLHNLHQDEKLSPKLEIISTGTDIQKFLEVKSTLMSREPDHWLPYLVVELAPFGDCLLRQINPKAASEKSNLRRLFVDKIVKMAVQLLDVMEYLHKKLQYTYTDWKPEHIYWNESTEQLKLIDWNVTNRLKNSSEKGKLIREDLRMFCGAALYCSLALTDPEDPTKTIGPEPTIPRDKVPLIPPRYWTDKPNFYERESVLDEKIKQIIQKGLDPKQGFNSPTEFKNELLDYAEQFDKQRDLQSDEQKNIDLINKLPQEAVQYYRRARSYIAAEDYSYAALSLETAIGTAKFAGMVYPDAEKLLESVQNILQAGEFREKVKLALDLGEWDAALNQYKKAIDLAPTNTSMQKEYDGLQELLRSDIRFRNKSLSRMFTNTFRLQAALESTKEILNSHNDLYASVKKQLNQIRVVQFGGIFILFAVIFFGLGLSGKLNFSGVFPIATMSPNPTHTTVPTETPTLTPTFMPTFSPTFTPISPTVKPSITFTPAPTSTITDTPVPVPTAAYGVLNVSFFYPVVEPNGKRIGDALEIKQFVTIIDSKIDREQLWYKCVWEINGETGEGWILAANIQFAPPPTPTP